MMNNDLELIVLHQNNSPEIIESLFREAKSLNINCIAIDVNIKKDYTELQNNFYLLYSVLDRVETESFLTLLSKQSSLIQYTSGRKALLGKSSILNTYEIPYVNIKSNNNEQLLKKINEIGGFPVLFSSDQFSNSLGKYYVENEQIFLHMINTIRNRKEFDYILKYIEHDFHIRVYIVNYQYNSAVIYYKDKNDYSTNRLDRGKRHKMSFSQNISPLIQQLAINHAKYLHVETAGIDILVSRNNEYYILEANNPMMYHVVSESLPVVSRGIVQGLLNKYEMALSDRSSLERSIPLVIPNKFISNEAAYLEILFTSKQLNISFQSEDDVIEGQSAIILNSKYCSPFIASNDKNFGFNAFLSAPLPKDKRELLEQHNIFEWHLYDIDITNPHQLKPNDLEQCCLFPVILKIEVDTGITDYLKVDTSKQCLSLISMYKDIKYKCKIYPFIYIYVKRKVLLVGSKVVAIIEYIKENDNQEAILNSDNTVNLDYDKISEQELATFKVLSDAFLFQGGWTLEYAIDIQSNVHVLSYDNGYDLDEFKSSTSDLLIPQIINKLFKAYNAH